MTIEPDTKVLIIGTGDGGGAPKGVDVPIATPASLPNLSITMISPAVALIVRFVNAYLTILIGLMTAIPISGAIPFTDFSDLLMKSAIGSVGGAAVGLLKDLLTIFGGLEKKYPLLTGNV